MQELRWVVRSTTSSTPQMEALCARYAQHPTNKCAEVETAWRRMTDDKVYREKYSTMSFIKIWTYHKIQCIECLNRLWNFRKCSRA